MFSNTSASNYSAPQSLYKRSLLKSTLQSHVGGQQVLSLLCFLFSLHKSLSDGSSLSEVGSDFFPLRSNKLLRGPFVQCVTVSQDHCLTDVPSRRAVSGPSGWTVFGCVSHNMWHSFSYSVLIAQAKCQNFFSFLFLFFLFFRCFHLYWSCQYQPMWDPQFHSLPTFHSNNSTPRCIWYIW